VKPIAAACFLLLASPVALASFNSFGPNPVVKDWKEEVRLRTGQTVVLERSVGRSVAGRMKWGGKTIRWTNGDVTGWPYVIDIHEGAPVLITGIGGPESCLKYGYPADSLVAWRYDGRAWVRMPKAPAGAIVNLRNGFPEQDDNELVTVRWKEHNQGKNAGGPYGLPLAAHAAKFSEACPRLSSAPSPKTERLVDPIIRAEDAAATILAERVSFATTPEEVSGTDALGAMGDWIDNVPVWMARKCRDSVQGFQPRFRHSPTVYEPAGVTINLHARVADPRIVVRGKIEYVFCDERTILVFRRGVADRYLVTRVEPSGRLVDASWVKLPGMSEVSAGTKDPPTIWNVRLADSQLTLTLADYVYPKWVQDGGSLRRKAVYEARLPDR
jgi:hypothetical protein